MNSKDRKPVIVALDFPSLNETLPFLEKLDPELCRVKVGKQLFVEVGPLAVKRIQDFGFDIFLDLKFHDIPNTVKEACLAVADLGCWMVNVHAGGGRVMLEAASNAYANLIDPPLLIGVTVLTSFSGSDLEEVGCVYAVENQVERLAVLSQSSGLDGVVCSPLELSLLSPLKNDKFLFVTPGVRCQGDEKHDQSRIATPQEALKNGADYIVIGRSITESSDPLERLFAINDFSSYQ